MACLCQTASAGVQNYKQSLFPVVETTLATVFQGQENLLYDISWTGGVKIGEMSLRIKRLKADSCRIKVRVKDYGLFRLFYPVDDTFNTYVSSQWKLPYRYEVLQKEAWGRVTRRLTLYDQKALTVKYRKNDEAVRSYDLNGPVYNEFSSFYITRCLEFKPGKTEIVPTFADHKRHEVVVYLSAQEKIDTLFGNIRTLKITPKMEFKGLYDKNGRTTIWFTDDECRVPVLINSKILIGSLTARLVGYTNSLCQKYPQRLSLFDGKKESE